MFLPWTRARRARVRKRGHSEFKPLAESRKGNPPLSPLPPFFVPGPLISSGDTSFSLSLFHTHAHTKGCSVFPSRTCTQREPKRGTERNYASSDARYIAARYPAERFGNYYARLRAFSVAGTRELTRRLRVCDCFHALTHRRASSFSASPFLVIACC